MPKYPLRAAFTIVELIAAIGVVTICMAAFVKIAHVARQQRDYGREHQTAVDQVQNVLELLAACDPVQLAAGDFDLTPHESLIARSLPQGKLLVTCEPLENDNTVLQTWRLDASVSWTPGANLPQRNISLVRLLSLQRDEGEEDIAITDEDEVSDEELETNPSPLDPSPSEVEGGAE